MSARVAVWALALATSQRDVAAAPGRCEAAAYMPGRARASTMVQAAARTGRRRGLAVIQGRQADAGPAAYTAQDGHGLLAAGPRIGHHVPDDARGALELPQQRARMDVDGLEPAVHGAVEGQAAGRG